MKRAAFTAACILLAATLLFWTIPDLILPAGALSFFLIFLTIPCYVAFRKRFLRDVLYGCCCFLCSALILYSPVTDFFEVRNEYEGETMVLTAVLTEDPQINDNGIYRYVVRPVDGPFSQKFVFFGPDALTSAGGTITAEFTFKKTNDSYYLENMSEGIVFNARLRTSAADVVISDPEPSFLTVSASLRRYVGKTLLRVVGGTEHGFLYAMLTGDKTMLSDRDYLSLEDTGMLHIVAVSGLHVSIFVSFVLFFLQKVRNLRLQLILSLLSLGMILLLAGFTPSVCRAVIMNGILFSHRLFALGSDRFNRLGIAAVLILLVSPCAALSLSFQLSFAAAFGILLLAKPITDVLVQGLFVRCNVICGSVLLNLVSLFGMSVAAFVFTLPLLWLRLDSYSVWSLLLSPIILPILEICFFATLAILCFAWIPFLLPFLRLLGYLLKYGVKFMTEILEYASSLMESADHLPAALKWVIGGAALLLAVFCFFVPAGKTKSKKKQKNLIRRGVGVVLAVIALLTVYQAADSVVSDITEGNVAPAEDVLQLAFLDVGQGNCFVSVLNGEAYVVDCGGTKRPGVVAADYLTSAGVDTVKFVLISHLHDDHANGLVDLCEEKKILEIIIPYTEGDPALYAQIVTLAAEEGATLTVLETDSERALGGSTLRMLTKHLDPVSEDQNENSIVGFCEYGEFRAMFTGDITSSAEKRLVTAYGKNLKCDVLSIPHHGSKSSSCAQFLEVTDPVYGVISVGANNTYGHPTEEVLSRLSYAGVKVLRTDAQSTILIRSDGVKMEVSSDYES